VLVAILAVTRRALGSAAPRQRAAIVEAHHLDRLTNLALDYSLAVKPGQVVVISGPGIAEPLIFKLFAAAIQRGARPIIRLAGDLYRETHVRANGADHDRWLNPAKVGEGAPVDHSIGLWALEDEPPTAAVEAEPAPSGDEEQTHQREFLQAAADEKLRWLALFYPTPAAARVAELSFKALDQLVVAADRLDEPDPSAAWRAQFAHQELLCKRLERARNLRFTSPSGIDLTMSIAGRKWINSGGHYNLPDGEVFTAPIESSITGLFIGDFPLLHLGQVIRSPRLFFEAGQLVQVDAEEGAVALRQLIATDPGASRVGEIALGLNRRITAGTKVSLIDEKIGGTFHLALGAAYPETGGTNDSLVHRDFVADLRGGGVVEIDGVPIELDFT